MERALKSFAKSHMKFIDLFYIQQKKISETSKILSISESSIRILKKELKDKIQDILTARNKWKSKKIGGNFWDFYFWWINAKKECHYCKVTQDQLDQLHEIGVVNKRVSRGKTLEIDRIKPNEDYLNIDNLTYSCYWCNNAKTDTFSEEEFLMIDKTIAKVWNARLKNHNKGV